MESDQTTLRARWRKHLNRWLHSGRIFRLYAPQADPAEPGGRHKLAICDLIPNLGDKVMVFPLLDALRRENPELEISFFTQGAGGLIGIHPAIDNLYLIESKQNRFVRIPFLARLIAWWWKHWRTLRFHTVVVLRGGTEPFRSHHLAWLLGGSSRVAYSTSLEPERPEYQYNVSTLFTAEVTEMRGVHEVTRGSEVLQLAGLLKDPVAINEPVKSLVDIASSPRSQSYRQQLGLDDQPYAVVALGASVPRRMWPEASFAELTRRQLITRGWRIVLVGGPEQVAIASDFKSRVGADVLDLIGKTNFEQLVAICGAAQCLVGNDSGTAHVAGACGVPTLIITAFARSSRISHHASPARSHPMGPWVEVVQPAEQLQPCITECCAAAVHCIAQVSVEEATLTLQELLAEAVAPSLHPASTSR